MLQLLINLALHIDIEDILQKFLNQRIENIYIFINSIQFIYA